MRTEIGHFAIEYDSVTYELYPTFKNMRKLCDPKEMPNFFSGLFGRETQSTAELISVVADNKYVEQISKKLIYKSINRIYEDAAFVIQCCCDDDVSKLTGFSSYDKGRKAWRAGVMHVDNVLSIARALITHGVVGQIDPDDRRKKGKATDSIDVYDYVENAIAHLGISYERAEMLTKTEYDRLIDKKYPEAKRGGNNAPTLSEHEAAMKWLDEVEARKEAKKKGAK